MLLDLYNQQEHKLSKLPNLDINPQLVIVRGLPGSGKSTLAREIAQACGYSHFENDMYFQTPAGYLYDAGKVDQARQWCYRLAAERLASNGKVIVSNVFTRISHMRAFLELTTSVLVVECTHSYGSIHPLPSSLLETMRSNWEPFAGAMLV